VSITWWAFVLSFLGGVIASLSPCSLGILPIIIGYIAGYSKKNWIKTLFQMTFFVLGMSIILTAIGLFCALSGKIFLNQYAAYFSLFINGIIFLMGLNLLGVFEFNMPVFIKEMPQNNGHDLFLYPLLIGALFALASTPCSTPILAGIMGYASLSANLITAGTMLFLFALGQGSIIILAGVFTSIFKNLQKISKFSSILIKISGICLISISLGIYIKIFSMLV
jgi:cytochrome c-type biogenesis protein